MMSHKSLLQDFSEIVSDIREYLDYQKDLGMEGLPVSHEFTDYPHESWILSANSLSTGGCKANSVILETIKKELTDCKRCKLHLERRNIVFGAGNEEAKLVFVGEAPGRDEDIRGEPFVGNAGQLLTKIINAINMTRKDVYIANIIKCRPPGNRDPEPDEIATCEPFLTRQIQVIRPKIICALGAFAAKTLLKTDRKISELRGRFHDYQGIKLIPTYHPAFLLRNPRFKQPVWEDMQMIQKEYPY